MDLLAPDRIQETVDAFRQDVGVRISAEGLNEARGDYDALAASWEARWKNEGMRAAFDAYHDLLARSGETDDASRIRWARDFDPNVVERGQQVEKASARFASDRDAAIGRIALARKLLYASLGDRCGAEMAAMLHEADGPVPFEIRDHLYIAAVRFLTLNGDGNRLHLHRGSDRDGPFAEAFYSRVAIEIGLDPSKDGNAVYRRISQPAYAYVETTHGAVEYIAEEMGPRGVHLLDTVNFQGGRSLVAIRIEEDELARLGTEAALDWGAALLRRNPDLFTIHGPWVADPSLRHDVDGLFLPSSLVDERGRDIDGLDDLRLMGLHVGLTHLRWPTERMNAEGAALLLGLVDRVRPMVEARGLPTFVGLHETMRSKVMAERIDGAPAAVDQAEERPRHGRIVEEAEDCLVYAYDQMADADVDSARAVAELAATYALGWRTRPDARPVDMTQFEEIVEKSIDAMRLRPAIDEYLQLLATGKVQGILSVGFDGGSHMPYDVCERFISAVYANGTDIDYELMVRAADVAVEYGHLLRLDKVAPAPVR